MPAPLEELFRRIETTLSAQLHQAGIVEHHGDRGENREEILSQFLSKHLPRRYGVAKGEVITKAGQRSHAIDLIIYDRINCPVLYSGMTKILPVEGVYGIIEMKSTLSKAELLDCTKKIERFKALASRDLTVVQTRSFVTVERSSLPFGLVVGYSLAQNSLTSLLENWREDNDRISNASRLTNLIAVLGQGLIYLEKADLDAGQRHPILATDELVLMTERVQKRIRNGELQENVVISAVVDERGGDTFGRVFTFLLAILSRMKLNPPDIGQYLDKDMPHMVVRE